MMSRARILRTSEDFKVRWMRTEHAASWISLAKDRRIIDKALEAARSVSSKLGYPPSESRGEYPVTPTVLRSMTSKTQDLQEEYLRISIAPRSMDFLCISLGGSVVCRAWDA